MLSDSPKLKTVKSPTKKAGWYSDKEKLEAVKLWLLTGNLVGTAAALNIPYGTIKEWRYAKWWEELVAELRTEGTIQLSQGLRKVAEKALGETLDRLENGDWIMNQKTGVLERKPVAMRDAYQVAAGFLDRHIELDRKPQEEANQQKVQDRLEALASAFERFAGKTPKPDIIDVESKEIDNALHAQREEGLQAGVGLGTQEEAFSAEGSCEESSGPEGDGEDLGGYAEFDACGPQETPEIGGFKLSEQLEMDDGQGQSV